MDTTRKKACSRCHREIDEHYTDGGQITWSGFINVEDGPYYHHVILCEHCHEELLKNIHCFLLKNRNYFMATRVDSEEEN